MIVALALAVSVMPVGQVDPLTHLGSLIESLRAPARIAVATDGTVLVTDPANNRVARFDSLGAFLGTWPVPDGPIGVAAHPDGRYFVSLRDVPKVAIYDEFFAFDSYLGDGEVTFIRPTDIDVATDTGRIYLVDAEADQIYGFESSGTLAVGFGTRGELPGQLQYPSAIAVDETNGRLVVADHDNFRVQTFTPSGYFQQRFGYRIMYLVGGAQEGWMPRSQGVVVDAAGYMYLADAMMSRVRVLSPTGSDLGKTIDYGSGPGSIYTPCDLALSPDGSKLYVVSTNTASVEIYAVPALGGRSEGSGWARDETPDPPGTNASGYDDLRDRPTRGFGKKRGRGARLSPAAPCSEDETGSAATTTTDDGPHFIDSSSDCGRCHGIVGQPGDDVSTIEGQTVLCLSCHSAGGQGLMMPMSALDVADPFGTNPTAPDGFGRTHAWGVSADEPMADAVPPGTDTLMGRYLEDGAIKCATCHNQHDNGPFPPYLRVSNAGDAMCKACHAARNRGPGEGGSHPVGFDYPGGVDEFPVDGAVSPLALKSGKVECLTCHGVHNADSGGANGGAGDGMLLRVANDDEFCRTCHTEHEVHDIRGPGEVSCAECHEVHDPLNENLALVAANIGGTSVTFQDDELGDDGLHDFIHSNHEPPSYDGICEVCHTSTNYHRNSSARDHTHFADMLCTDCHPHDNGFLPTSTSCTACHARPPDGDAYPNTAGSHALHVTDADGPGVTNCFDCHATIGGGSHENGQASFASGIDANGDGDIDLSETDVCDVCHSPDGAFDGVTDITIGAKANWMGGAYSGSSLAAGKEQWCAGCHDLGTSTIDGVDAPPVAGDNVTWGYYVTGHGRSGAVPCTYCHDPQAAHIDGIPRTYSAVADNYREGYRLALVDGQTPLTVPIDYIPSVTGREQPEDYRLCFRCHAPYQTLGDIGRPDTIGDWLLTSWGTNFRNEDGVSPLTDVRNGHYEHVGRPGPGGALPGPWDSDWDGVVDSRPSCPTCHNVHGSSATAMTRRGELISAPPDRIDKVPALDFRWYEDDGVTQTTDLGASRWGHMPPMEGAGSVHIGDSHVCDACHGGPDSARYYRTPVTTLVGCGACHSQAQDNGDGIPVGGRRGVVGEFPVGDAHAHYGGELDSAACTVCHEMGTHTDGTVDLLDADTGTLYSFVYASELNSDPDLSTFCASCHDADGAARLGAAAMDPFADGNAPPDVAGKFQGTLQWDEWYGDGCFGFEGTLRQVNSHHDISDADQAWSGAKVECLSCHGAHTVGETQPVSDPFDTTTAWTGTTNAFCLECHWGGFGPDDPAMPADVFGPTVPLRPLDTCDMYGPPWWVQYSWTHTAHGLDSKRGWDGYSGAPGTEVDCLACHDAHGSYTPTNTLGNPYAIRDSVNGTLFVDDGVEPTWTGPPWDDADSQGTLQDPVVVSISGTDVAWGELCVACHADWTSAYFFHDTCTGCQSCHGHGQVWGNDDWGAGANDSTLCPPNNHCSHPTAITLVGDMCDEASGNVGAPCTSDAECTDACDEASDNVGTPCTNDGQCVNGLCGTGLCDEVFDATVYVTTTVADDDNITACGGTAPTQTLWYSIAGTGNTITVTTCMPGTTFDTNLRVFCDTCDSLTCVASNDDDALCGSSGVASTASFCSGANQTYLIQVGGANGESGLLEMYVVDDATACGAPDGCPAVPAPLIDGTALPVPIDTRVRVAPHPETGDPVPLHRPGAGR